MPPVDRQPANMSKVDVKRNYYGDLELGPNADPTEINKQYKKLGSPSAT